ncbi:rhodanese-like domain-containing protein [Aestuariivivens sediminis]|uniref:rhodanese-like domain-containing protein n=1 Tax=Aestuariivivens sediminis TaxID=2913557 RepID=UPI001F591988|nr:rhodanese-like domain-containing protein [Aestuariivivens sediminis]
MMITTANTIHHDQRSFPSLRRMLILSGFLMWALQLHPQDTLSGLLSRYNTRSIPYISVQELAMPKTKAMVLDAREEKEFNVSHIKHAIHVGYESFNLDSVQRLLPDKNADIVVYCSIGIRSEAIAEVLKKGGYTHVKNLYGGIFEWKNHNFPVYNLEHKETDSIHIYSNEWRSWLKKGIKVYD